MKHSMTIDPDARFLDSDRIISDLEKAEQERTLDADGVIEKLKEAYSSCQSAADRYTVRAAEARRAGDAYIIARGKYLAEIKRRVECPRGTNAGVLKTSERIGWVNWCRQNGVTIGRTYAYIDAAKGDMTKINKERFQNRERIRRKKNLNPLKNIKRMWGYLTPEERSEFIQWLLSGQDKAAA